MLYCRAYFIVCKYHCQKVSKKKVIGLKVRKVESLSLFFRPQVPYITYRIAGFVCEVLNCVNYVRGCELA